jgi:hypothetical protein
MFTQPGYMCDYYWLCALASPEDALDMFVIGEEHEFDFNEYLSRKEQLKSLWSVNENKNKDLPQPPVD